MRAEEDRPGRSTRSRQRSGAPQERIGAFACGSCGEGPGAAATIKLHCQPTRVEAAAAAAACRGLAHAGRSASDEDGRSCSAITGNADRRQFAPTAGFHSSQHQWSPAILTQLGLSVPGAL